MMVRGKNENGGRKAVDNVRRIELFISCLKPSITEEEIIQLAQGILSNSDSKVKAEKLKTRFKSYASFLVKRLIFNETLSLLYSENFWPEGVELCAQILN